MIHSVKKTTALVILILIAAANPFASHADDFRIEPSILVREEYNDNIFFSNNDKIDDFITTVAGTLDIIERTERLEANLFGRVAPFWYADNSDLDETDWSAEANASYRFTPKFSAGGNAGYLVDNRPDRDVDVTGVTLSARKRKRTTAGAGASYTFNETNAASLAYAFRKDNFDGDSSDNSKIHDVSAGWTTNLSGWWETTIARFNIGYGYYDYDTSQTDLIYATVGAEHRFTEKLTGLLDVGPRYNNSDFKTVQLKEVFPGIFVTEVVDDTSSDWGGVGNLELNYRGERTFSSFSASYGLFPSSGNLGPTQRTTTRFNISHRLLEKLRLSLGTGWIRNKANSDEFSAQDIDQDTAYIRPFMRWEFYDNFTLEAQYNFTYIWDHADNEERYRNLVFVQLAYGLPLFDLLE